MAGVKTALLIKTEQRTLGMRASSPRRHRSLLHTRDDRTEARFSDAHHSYEGEDWLGPAKEFMLKASLDRST
jgi:hypothetical protein